MVDITDTNAQDTSTNTTNEEETLEALKLFQRSPFAFFKEAFNEDPQPIKPEYKEHVLKLYTVPAYEFSKYALTIQQDMFEPFVKGKHLTWQQSIFVIAVQRAVNGSLPRKIAVKAGRGTGKSNCMSKLILWFLFSFPASKIPCTAPTADQLFAVLWSELNMVLAKMKPEYADMFEWETKFLRMKGKSSSYWYARAKTAGKGETGALSGIHADYMASFADESYDIEDEVFQIAEATQTGDISLMILVGNAVHDRGYFFECFNKHEDQWIQLTMNGEESPIVNKEVIEAQEKQYGKDSNHYRASVLGEFPISTSVDVDGWARHFTDDWIDEVMPTESKEGDGELFDEREYKIKRTYLGIDPAGDGGDEAVGYIRNQQIAKLAFSAIASTTRSIAMSVIGAIDLYELEGIDAVCDNFGVGADLSQKVMVESQSRCVIDGVNVGKICEDILDKSVYTNERARIFDALLWWGKRGGRIAYDENLRNELKTIISRKNESGKLQIMPKKEMRKRGLKSPGRADALALTFVNDRMMSNLVPRGDFKAISYQTKNGRNKQEDTFDRYSTVPDF